MNYGIYYLPWKEKLRYSLQGFLIFTVLGILFYRSVLGILFLLPFIFFYQKYQLKNQINELKWRLNLEFKDGIQAVSAALEAGYCAENAFEEAYQDLGQIYAPDSMIQRELSYIVNQLRMNITVEKALAEFAGRSGIEDIKSFADVFSTAKRTGGDLIHIIKVTSDIISDKIEVKREILTLLSAKRLEANIMKVMPLFILIYLSLSSPGFLDPLYHNLLGIFVMSVFLLCYLGACLVIDKIIKIEV
ncbi:MAG TPA: type II secretion system protein F [Clostridiales bacterium]|nr:type II secretion system protein F [Clostridiales bacterium]